MRRHPSNPPPVILSGRVVEYAVLPASVRYSGAALHIVGGKELGRVPCLAIERELRTDDVALLYCKRDWSVVATHPADTVAKAKRRAERMYPGSSAHWQPSGVTNAQASAHLAHRWDGFECSFCRRTPDEIDSLFENGAARICDRCVSEFHADLAIKKRRG